MDEPGSGFGIGEFHGKGQTYVQDFCSHSMHE